MLRHMNKRTLVLALLAAAGCTRPEPETDQAPADSMATSPHTIPSDPDSAAGQPLHVDIYIDDQMWARVPVNEPSPGLRDRGFGMGQHGFTFTMPDYVRDGRPHMIEVKVAETGRTLRNTPQELTCR